MKMFDSSSPAVRLKIDLVIGSTRSSDLAGLGLGPDLRAVEVLTQTYGRWQLASPCFSK